MFLGSFLREVPIERAIYPWAQSARSSSPPGLHSLYRPPRFAGLRKCPQPASAPVRVARSASAPSHPRSPPILKSYGFIPHSTATSSARQLIAAACSASPLHVRAILTRAALSVGSGRCALIEGNQWRFADSRRECSRPSPPVLVPRGIRCHESAAKKGQDIEGQRGIDCASAPRKLAVDLKGRSAHTSVPKAAFMPALFDGPICGPHGAARFSESACIGWSFAHIAR